MIAAIIAKLGGGAIMGILGSVVSNIFTLFANKQKHQQDIEIRKLQLLEMDKQKEYMVEEAKIDMQVTKTKIEGEIELEGSRAFSESIKDATKPLLSQTVLERMVNSNRWWIQLFGVIVSFLFGLVDFVKHLLRPSMTIFISIMFGYIVIRAYGILGDDYEWSKTEAIEIITIAVDMVISLVGLVWGWWFADRRFAKTMRRLDGINVK